MRTNGICRPAPPKPVKNAQAQHYFSEIQGVNKKTPPYKWPGKSALFSSKEDVQFASPEKNDARRAESSPAFTWFLRFS